MGELQLDGHRVFQAPPSPLCSTGYTIRACKFAPDLSVSGLVRIWGRLWIQVLSPKNLARGRTWAGKARQIWLLLRAFILHNPRTPCLLDSIHTQGKKGRLLKDDNKEA